MSVTVRIAGSFKAAVKPLLKKYPSLKEDLLRLEMSLVENPHQGTALGNNAYKIRLRISSKGKGKSGGARVISLVEAELVGEVEVIDEKIAVNLVTIYDKSDTATITDKELKELVRIIHQER